MMALVDSIISVIIDIVSISNCGLLIADYQALTVFAVLPGLVKIAKSSPTRSVGLNLARPFKGNNILGASAICSIAELVR
jgi:hypothetical protein